MIILKNLIPLLVTVFIGIIMIIEFFFNVPWASGVSGIILSWVPVIAAFTIMVGTLNLMLVNGKAIRRKTSGWYKSAVLLVSLFATIILGLSQGTNSEAYEFVFDNILSATGSTMFALCAFYIGSASFRAFRATNLHATILLISGALLMLGRVPVGEYISKSMPTIAEWIMDVPNVAGQRGIMISTGLGFVSQCLRVLLGYSRRHLGTTE